MHDGRRTHEDGSRVPLPLSPFILPLPSFLSFTHPTLLSLFFLHLTRSSSPLSVSAHTAPPSHHGLCGSRLSTAADVESPNPTCIACTLISCHFSPLQPVCIRVPSTLSPFFSSLTGAASFSLLRRFLLFSLLFSLLFPSRINQAKIPPKNKTKHFFPPASSSLELFRCVDSRSQASSLIAPFTSISHTQPAPTSPNTNIL